MTIETQRLFRRTMLRRTMLRRTILRLAAAFPAFAIAFAIASTGSTARAQSDAELWLFAGVKGDVGSGFGLGVNQQLRLNDDMSQLSTVLTDFYVSYDVTDWFRIQPTYRIGWARSRNRGLQIFHRPQIDFRAKASFGEFRVSYRVRFQERIRWDRDDDTRHEHGLRNRISAEWKTESGLVPSAEAELFLDIAGDDGTEFYRQRFSIGCAYGFDAHEVELGYRTDISLDDGDIAHILRAGYTLSLE